MKQMRTDVSSASVVSEYFSEDDDDEEDDDEDDNIDGNIFPSTKSVKYFLPSISFPHSDNSIIIVSITIINLANWSKF